MNQSGELLKGQNALVTGANSGIGEATARALAAAGATVVVNYVTHAPAGREGRKRHQSGRRPGHRHSGRCQQ